MLKFENLKIPKIEYVIAIWTLGPITIVSWFSTNKGNLVIDLKFTL